MEHVLEFFIHALQDTWPMLPWILLMYIVVELLESRTDVTSARLNGTLGPLIGSATGLIPQCGFSVMAAKLFEKKYITVGTLLAVFFSTSDEAFILLLSSGTGAVWVLPTLAVKVLVGVAIGYGMDALLKAVGRAQSVVEMPKAEENALTTTHEIFIARFQEERDVEVVCSCGRTHGEGSPWKKYVLSPILRTLQVGVFIFIVNFILTAIIHTVGEDAFAAFMQSSKFLQPFITCAVGLIPNCASSVVITETFLSGGIAFGSFVAGLCANAGMGFVVLLKNTRKWKRNLLLLATSYFVSVAVGMLCNLLPI